MTRTATAAPIEHYENFPVASVLCPAHLRAPIAAIYHFARTADDIADEGPATASERLQALADYRRQLVRVAESAESKAGASVELDPRWAGVFSALGQAIQGHHLPVRLLHDLLDAFVQDIEKTRGRAFGLHAGAAA